MKRKTMVKLVLLAGTALCGTYCSDSEKEQGNEQKPGPKKTEEARKDEKPSQPRTNESPERPAPSTPNQTPPAPTPQSAVESSPAAAPTFLSECAKAVNSQLMNELRALARAEDCRQTFEILSARSSLRLIGKDLVDVGPLGFLTNLKRLSLDDNKIEDISAFSKLANLEYLSLRNNIVADVGPLAGLPRLKVVRLEGNTIIDLAPLGRISTLELASLQNGVRSFSSLLTRGDSNERVDWRYGENTCSGGWEYDEYRECRHESHGVESFRESNSAACGERSREPVYRSCRDPENGYSNRWFRVERAGARFEGNTTAEMHGKCDSWHSAIRGRLRAHQRTSGFDRNITQRPGVVHERTGPFGSIVRPRVVGGVIQCAVDIDEAHPNEARHRNCGVERYDVTYNRCRHPSHGIEAYVSRRSPTCGASGTRKYSAPMATHASVQPFGELKSCSTCDNVLIGSTNNPSAKLACIDQQLQKNLSETVNQELVSAAKLLYRVFTSRLTSDQIDFVQWLDDRYPNVGYPNNRSL